MKTKTKTLDAKTYNFGVALKKERQKLNISHPKLANHIGVSVSTLKRWEKGNSKPQLHLRTRLIKFFGEQSEVTNAVDKFGMTLKRQSEKVLSSDNGIKFLEAMMRGELPERQKLLELFGEIDLIISEL